MPLLIWQPPGGATTGPLEVRVADMLYTFADNQPLYVDQDKSAAVQAAILVLVPSSTITTTPE